MESGEEEKHFGCFAASGLVAISDAFPHHKSLVGTLIMMELVHTIPIYRVYQPYDMMSCFELFSPWIVLNLFLAG